MQQRRHAPTLRAAPHKTPVREFLTKEHVLSHRQRRYQAQILVDDGDAGVDRLLGRELRMDMLVDSDLARVRLYRSGQAADQRGFSGAVRPKQGMHLAGVDLEVDT